MSFKSVFLISLGTAVVAVTAFVVSLLAIWRADTEPTPVEFGPILIVDESQRIPEVPSFLPPSILVSFNDCYSALVNDFRNCTAVPILLERINNTDQTIEVEASAVWTNLVLDDSLNVVADESDYVCTLNRSQRFPLIPGLSQAQLVGHPNECVLERVQQLQDMGVGASVWAITSTLDPVSEGRTVSATGPNFTLVHPDAVP